MRLKSVLQGVVTYFTLIFCVCCYLLSVVTTRYSYVIATPTPTPVFAPQYFVGEGRDSTPSFWLSPGLATFHIVYEGQEQVDVRLWHIKQRRSKPLVEGKGHFDKSVQIVVEEGSDYRVEVYTTGVPNWRIEVSQP